MMDLCLMLTILRKSLKIGYLRGRVTRRKIFYIWIFASSCVIETYAIVMEKRHRC